VDNLLKTDTAWIQTYTGKPFWPLNPRPEDLDIIDIAHSLAHQCRYSGHTKQFYSVAEHSVHISYFVKPENALWGLMHDASEAYLSDIPRPIKPLLPQYKEAEKRLMDCIAFRFNFSEEEPAEVKEMDTLILHNERRDLMLPSALEWGLQGEPIPNLTIEGWSPNKAKALFLRRYLELTTGFAERFPADA
jgi:hypothetical protein